MGTITLNRSENSARDLAVQNMQQAGTLEKTDAAPAFDDKKPSALICGEPGVFYVQGDWFYSRAKQAVRMAPTHERYAPKAKVRTRAEVEDLKQRSQQIKLEGQFIPAEPETVVAMRRENRQARAAEEAAA